MKSISFYRQFEPKFSEMTAVKLNQNERINLKKIPILMKESVTIFLCIDLFKSACVFAICKYVLITAELRNLPRRSVVIITHLRELVSKFIIVN